MMVTKCFGIIGILLFQCWIIPGMTEDLGVTNPTIDPHASSCPTPNVTYNGSVLSGDILESLASFKAVEDVEFDVQIGPLASGRQKCKLSCRNGKWVGPLCRKAKEDTYKSLLRSCELNIHPPKQILTYQYQELQLSESTLFPHGAEIQIRCNSSKPGLFAQEGNSTLTCQNGQWDSRLPYCRETSGIEDFNGDLPPQISVVNAGGHVHEGPGGELIVYPGSIIHLDCIFNRKLGNPTWSWASSGKVYPTGWVVSGLERNWHFRMSIYYAKLNDDSNVFTCTSPRGHKNSIAIEISDVQCPEFHIADVELESRLESRKIGSVATFSCPLGFVLQGPEKIACQKNGQWSRSPPYCEPTRCSALEILDPHLRVLALNNSYKGEAEFLCPFGYKLVGKESIACGSRGNWTGTVPKCEAIECPPPLAPHNGKILSRDKYLVGHTVQYTCYEGYVLIGEPIIRCTDTGLWSHATPFCKRACRFPGDPVHGRITPVKFLYEIGDKILVQCHSGFVNTGKQKLQCLENGGWSDRVPKCHNYMGSTR